jgi:hypothetical protein
MKKITRSGKRLVVAGLLMAAASNLHAAEGGGSNYPTGGDNFLMGAVPPPGFYTLIFGNAYRADEFLNSDGDNVAPDDFKITANVVAPRLVWSTPYEIGGGTLVMHGVFPLVDLKVEAGGASDHKSGLGDVMFGPGIVYHYSEKLHAVLGVDFVAPTGEYDSSDMVNLGRNYWSTIGLYTMSYIDPNGFNGDFKANLLFNQENDATKYKTGTELVVDYAVGYGLGNGWTLGASGYFYNQLQNDEQNGSTLSGSKSKAFSIGPSIKYMNDKGWVFTAKYEEEVYARNRPSGYAFRLKTSIPF